MLEGSFVTLHEKKSNGPARLRQLWRIEHIGEHSYVIRSVYRPDFVLNVTDNRVTVASLSTTVSGDSVPLNRRWGIARSSNSFMLQYVGTSYYTMKPADGALSPGTSVITSSASPQYCWTFEWYSSLSNQVLLINTKLGLPAISAVRYVYQGETVALDDLNLMATFVSKYTIYQDIRWSSNNTAVATVDAVTGAVTGVSPGQATISASQIYNGVSYSQTYTINVNKDFMLYGVTNSGHDHASALEGVMDDINSQYPVSRAKLRTGAISAQTCKSDLLSANVFTSRSHGGFIMFSDVDQVAVTFILLDDDEELFWSNAYPELDNDNSAIVDGDDYSNLGLALFIACCTGRGGTGANNLPSEIVEHGAKVAIGFENEIMCNHANTWTTVFYERLLSGATVEDSAEQASSQCYKDDPNLGFEFVVIAGNGTLTLADLI
ncbi:MAG: Ig-like domain-containing protein [Oscillospiraceae bacterium]|nr:Ig-like domain-containing protein [Oscillospiraceae bacterium]